MRLVMTKPELLIMVQELCGDLITDVEVDTMNIVSGDHPTSLITAVKAMAENRVNKIPIVKFVRAQTGWDLKRSKEFVEKHSVDVPF
jgi:ribosomal protein L7/L12